MRGQETGKEVAQVAQREEKRQRGLDLLRVVSMFLVVILHLLGRGGVKEAILACKDATYSESFVSSAAPTWSGTQMSLYNGVDARYQMNSKNKAYWVLGLRKKN